MHALHAGSTAHSARGMVRDTGNRPPPRVPLGYDGPPRLRPDAIHPPTSYYPHHRGFHPLDNDDMMPLHLCVCCGIISSDDEIFVRTKFWGIACIACVRTGRMSFMVQHEVRNYDITPIRFRPSLHPLYGY